MQDFHLLSQLCKWIALHHTPLCRRAEGRTCFTSVDSGDTADRLDLEQEKECTYICHSPMQGEHSRKGPKRCISAGSQRKGNHDCGWAVLSASVQSLGFPLTEQDRAAGSCLSESVQGKWSGSSFWSFPTDLYGNTANLEIIVFCFLFQIWDTALFDSIFMKLKKLNNIGSNEKEQGLWHLINIEF